MGLLHDFENFAEGLFEALMATLDNHVARWGEDCNLRLGRDIVKRSPDRETQTSTQYAEGLWRHTTSDRTNIFIKLILDNGPVTPPRPAPPTSYSRLQWTENIDRL